MSANLDPRVSRLSEPGAAIGTSNDGHPPKNTESQVRSPTSHPPVKRARGIEPLRSDQRRSGRGERQGGWG